MHLRACAFCDGLRSAPVPVAQKLGVEADDSRMQCGNRTSVRVVEYWRWRYRDPKTGRICRTAFQMSAEEATAKLFEPERIDGTMSLRKMDVDAEGP